VRYSTMISTYVTQRIVYLTLFGADMSPCFAQLE
jgi:hypothetical protein